MQWARSFLPSLNKTHFLPGFINESPDLYLLKRHLIVDSLIPYFLADQRIETPSVYIPSKMLTKHNLPEDIEAAFIELNFRKCKWLLCATYRAPSQNHNYFFDNIDKCLDLYSTNKRVVLASDLNAQVGEKSFDTFLYQHQLTSISRNPTCYKNPNNPSCIDHILTNSPKSFFKTETVFTGLSDFHKLVLSVFKLHFSKAKAKKISYRNFRDFKEDNFNLQNFQQNL